MPAINSQIRDSGIIEFGEDTRLEDVDRVVKRLADAAAYNAPRPKAKAVTDQAEAVREAKAVDLPALAEANRITIKSASSGGQAEPARNPKSVEPFRPRHSVRTRYRQAVGSWRRHFSSFTTRS